MIQNVAQSPEWMDVDDNGVSMLFCDVTSEILSKHISGNFGMWEVRDTGVKHLAASMNLCLSAR